MDSLEPRRGRDVLHDALLLGHPRAGVDTDLILPLTEKVRGKRHKGSGRRGASRELQEEARKDVHVRPHRVLDLDSQDGAFRENRWIWGGFNSQVSVSGVLSNWDTYASRRWTGGHLAA